MTIRINTSYAYIIIIRDSKALVWIVGTDPDLAALYKRKYISVADSIKTSNYCKLFSYLISCAMYSLNREKGGFVTTISASFRISMHSGLLKSPSPVRGVFVGSLSPKLNTYLYVDFPES